MKFVSVHNTVWRGSGTGRERERSLGSGSSPSLWVHVTGSCEERQSSQLLPSLEVTQNWASGAREGWAASTSALRVDGWMLVWRTLLQRRCTWAAGNEPKLKCQNPWTREFVKGRQGVFSEVEGQCRDQKANKLEIQEAPSQSTGTTPVNKNLHSENSKRSSERGIIEISIGMSFANVSSRQFSSSTNILNFETSSYQGVISSELPFLSRPLSHGHECEHLEFRQAGSSFDVWLTGWLVNERHCQFNCIGTHVCERWMTGRAQWARRWKMHVFAVVDSHQSEADVVRNVSACFCGLKFQKRTCACPNQV